jgi:hypothetical protein
MIPSLALRKMHRVTALCLFLILFVCSFHALPTIGQTGKSTASQQDQTAAIVGCYELQLGRWWPWGYGADNPFVTPPKRVQLLAERGTEGFEQDGFLLRAIPEPGKPAGGRGRPSYWQVDSEKQVSLMWNDGWRNAQARERWQRSSRLGAPSLRLAAFHSAHRSCRGH